MSFPFAHPVGALARTAAVAPGWPATLEAAEAELARPAGLLDGASTPVVPTAGALAIPALDPGPGDATGIRVRTAGNPPHALYVIVGSDLPSHAGAPREPHCLPGPSTD
ncbi:hypothetical protein [Streptomyces sp. NPDC001809]